MSQEISNTIAQIDGVVMARVHLVMPERNPLADKPQPAAASVFIKHRPDKDLSGQTAQIKALVVNALEGLPYDNVTVALFPAERMAEEPKTREAPARSLPVMAGAGMGMLALSGGGLLWWRRRRGGGAPPAPALRAVTPLQCRTDAARLSDEMHAALRRAGGRP